MGTVVETTSGIVLNCLDPLGTAWIPWELPGSLGNCLDPLGTAWISWELPGSLGNVSGSLGNVSGSLGNCLRLHCQLTLAALRMDMGAVDEAGTG